MVTGDVPTGPAGPVAPGNIFVPKHLRFDSQGGGASIPDPTPDTSQRLDVQRKDIDRRWALEISCRTYFFTGSSSKRGRDPCS